MPQKRFAVIGHPIGHTMSPFIHKRLLQLAGVDGTYEKLEIPPQAFNARFLDTLCKLDGFNVTIPYKTRVLPYLDLVSGDAAAFGSVNTVAVRRGAAEGYTTDGVGFLRALKQAGIPLRGRILLLGTGGVSHVFANEILRAPGVTSLTILMRRRPEETPLPQDCAVDVQKKNALRLTREKAFCESLSQPLLHRFTARAPSGVLQMIDREQLEQTCQAAESPCFDLLINATNAGMYPHFADSPVSKSVVAACRAVFDAVYNPGVTQLLHDARACGIPCTGGMGMLVWQALAAESIWFGNRFRGKQIEPIIDAAAQAMQWQFGNLVLCGFMGSGKTTVGQLTAEKLGRRFVDLDAFIEQREQMPVSELFRKKGEAYFRACEAQACRALSRESNLVIATGGGTVTNAGNAALLRETGVIFLLDPPYSAIARRLEGDHTRPLLEQADKQAVMRRLYEQRMPLYRAAADYTVCADSSAETARRIVEIIAEKSTGGPIGNS